MAKYSLPEIIDMYQAGTINNIEEYIYLNLEKENSFFEGLLNSLTQNNITGSVFRLEDSKGSYFDISLERIQDISTNTATLYFKHYNYYTRTTATYYYFQKNYNNQNTTAYSNSTRSIQEITINASNLSSASIENNFKNYLNTNNGIEFISFSETPLSLKGYLIKFINKLQRKHEEADYYMSLAQLWLTPSYTYECNVSGITCGECSCSLIGNLLHIYTTLTLTSAAQTTIGTGNVTNRKIFTVFFNDIYDPEDKRYGINNSISVGHGSAYSAGNAQPASFHTYTRKPTAWTANTAYSSGAIVVANSKFYQCSTAHTSGSSFATTNWTQLTTPSGTSISINTLVAQTYIDAVVTSTTNYRLYIDIPVTRKKYEG